MTTIAACSQTCRRMPLPVRARTAGPLRWVKKPIIAGRTRGQASSIATEPNRASGPLSRQN